MGVGSKSESRHFSPHLGLYAVPSHHPPSFGPLSSPSHQLPDYTLTFPRQVCPPHCHMFLLCSELSGGSHLQVKAKAVAIVLAMVHESLEHLSPPLASGTSLPTSSPLLSLLQLHWPSCCPQTCQAVSDPRAFALAIPSLQRMFIPSLLSHAGPDVTSSERQTLDGLPKVAPLPRHTPYPFFFFVAHKAQPVRSQLFSLKTQSQSCQILLFTKRYQKCGLFYFFIFANPFLKVRNKFQSAGHVKHIPGHLLDASLQPLPLPLRTTRHFTQRN